MKRILAFFFPALAGTAAALLLSCAGTPATSGTGPGSGSPPPQGRPQVNITKEIIDYQGAAVGAAIPDWVTNVIGDTGTFEDSPRFEGKVPFIFDGQGQNLDLLRSWVTNFDIASQVSTRISQHVRQVFVGELKGNKDTAGNQSYADRVVENVSANSFSGLAKEMDYWVKNRDTVTGAEEYTYYVVYSMSKEDLDYQIAQAMGKVAAETQEQEEIKSNVETRMKQLAFSNIQPVNN